MILLFYNNIMFAFDFIIFILLLHVIFPALHILGLILLNIIITKLNNIRFDFKHFIYLCLIFVLRVFFWFYIFSTISDILKKIN
jgi:hypothetical protein